MKPILWESLLETFYLSQDGALTSQQGMDTRLLLLAREQGKTIQNIESGLTQMQMLSGFSDALQAMLLRQTAKQFGISKSTVHADGTIKNDLRIG